MLERILREFRATALPLSAPLLSQRLDIDQAALEGMLETLERKGRIRQVDAADAAGVCQCDTCPLQTLCPPEHRWYRLTPADAASPGGAESAPEPRHDTMP